MKTTWRLLVAALLVPAAQAAQAAGYLDGAMKSPASFDEALSAEQVELASMLEPEPADAAPAPAAEAKAPAASACCDSVGDCCGDACCDDPCCGDDTCCGDACRVCCCPTWTFRGGAVILERVPNDRTLLIEDRTGGTAGDGFADAFDFGYSGGVDLSLIRWLESGKSIETRFFGGMEWEDQQTYTSAAGWALPTNPPRLGTGVANIDAVYNSRLNSAETNLRSVAHGSITYLIGFRWIELNEDLTVDGDFGGNPTNARFDTDNNLYGGQIGADANLFRGGGPFSANAWIKAGIYGNDADSSVALNQSVGPDVFGATSKGQTAFVGDVAFTGSYALTDHLAFRSGYQLLWIEGVAIASDQIAATNIITGQGIDSEGESFYHGALFSLDATW